MNMHVFVHSGAIIPIGLALLLAFSIGFRDSSTIVATVVSTRVLTPGVAFFLCAGFEFLGAVFVGKAVALTIGAGLAGPLAAQAGEAILIILCAALGSAFIWGIVSWLRAWPTSNNQALFAALLGAILAVHGSRSFENKVIGRVLLALIISPIIGFIISTVLTAFLRWAGEWLTPKVKTLSQGLHVLACLIVSSAHGSNDAQTIGGIIMPAFFLAGLASPAEGGSAGIPLSMRFWMGAAISMGVVLGGRRILKRMGMKFYRIRDTEGVGAEMASACTIVGCAVAGLPASTTQVIAGSIVGAGVAKNPRAVRWAVAQEIVLSWIITLPAVGLIGYLVCGGLLVMAR